MDLNFRPMRSYTLLILALALLTADCASAMVFFSKEEAFELAFGKGAEVVDHPIYLSDEQSAEIEKLAQVKLDSQLITFYEGHSKGQLIGYALIDSHTVRTQPETFLIVLSPKGDLLRSEILAFHEPLEYKPSPAWLQHLVGHPIGDLQLNQGIDGIAGATLSSRAALNGVRKALAIYQVALKNEAP